MASEIQASYASGRTLYCLIRGQSLSIGQIWNGTSLVAYTSANYSQYPVSMTEQGTGGFYTGTFPSSLSAGTYSIVVKNQIGGSAAETDPAVAVGNLEWNGSNPAPLSDTVVSGQLGGFLPVRLYRGSQLLNFPFKLVSSADHISVFTSGVVSGQISKDGGAFGTLQSGAFTEIGLGWYKLQALTSGDTNANTIALVFNAVGISGGSADNRDFAIITQRVSGQG